MNIQARNTALYCATLAGLLMLSACGKNDQESGPPASPAPPASAPAPSPTMPPPAATQSAPPQPAPPASTPPPASSSGKSASVQPHDIKVTAVTIGGAVDASSLAISKEQRRFSPQDKSIYASVATTGNTDNATLNAQWSYEDGKEQPFSSTSESIATDGPATTTFKVQNPNPWPTGKYKVVISLNGKAVASENFEVRS